MPKQFGIYGLTLIILVGYLVLFIITGVTAILSLVGKKLRDTLTKLAWTRSNIRIKLYLHDKSRSSRPT